MMVILKGRGKGGWRAGREGDGRKEGKDGELGGTAWASESLLASVVIELTLGRSRGIYRIELLGGRCESKEVWIDFGGKRLGGKERLRFQLALLSSSSLSTTAFLPRDGFHSKLGVHCHLRQSILALFLDLS